MTKARRYTRSSSLALGLLISLLLLISVLFSIYVLIAATDQDLSAETEAAILSESFLLREYLERNGVAAFDTFLRESDDRGLLSGLRGADDSHLGGTFHDWPSEQSETDGLISFETIITDDQGLPISTDSQLIMAKRTILPGGEHLWVSRNIDNLFYAQPFAQGFSWIMSAIILLFAVGSIAVGIYVFDRMNRVADTAISIIDTGDLSRRLPVDSTWDDLSKMSMVLNRFLGEMEEMVHGAKTLADAIAHDLRTPLARLRNTIEVSPDGEHKTQLLAEVDDILSIFNSLLRISAIETQKRRDAFQVLRLQEIVGDAIELYVPVAEEKEILLRGKITPCTLEGDRDLLFQMISNLIDNAVKFTPPGGEVEVSCQQDDQHVVIEVSDSGPGIAPEHREDVLKRFFRVDSSRSARGNGLGLAMVAAVVKLHRGRLQLLSRLDRNSSIGQVSGLRCRVEFARSG